MTRKMAEDRTLSPFMGIYRPVKTYENQAPPHDSELHIKDVLSV